MRAKIIPGVFTDYHLHAGGLWSGDYLVADPAHFRQDCDVAKSRVKIHRANQLLINSILLSKSKVMNKKGFSSLFRIQVRRWIRKLSLILCRMRSRLCMGTVRLCNWLIINLINRRRTQFTKVVLIYKCENECLTLLLPTRNKVKSS